MGMQLSAQQLGQLQQLQQDKYQAELVITLADTFPHLTYTMTAEALRDAVIAGIAQAAQYGFNQRGSVQLYLNLMIVLGAGFATDPQFTWLAEIRTQQDHLSQLALANHLYLQVNDYLDGVIGKDQQALFACAYRLQQLEIDQLNITHSTMTQDICQLFANVYPEKYQAIARQSLYTLIDTGYQKATQDYYLNQPQDIGVVMLLVFLLGQDFDRDPFIVWANRRHMMPYLADSALLIKKLTSRTKNYLTAALKNHEEATKVALIAQQGS